MQRTPNAPRGSVVVTGSSTGIGAASALALDRLGFRVFAGVRLEADGRRLQQSASPNLTPIFLDVSSQESVRAAAEHVCQATGPAELAGVVNNAGIAIVGPLELVPLAEVRRQFEVNVMGMLAVIQAFLPALRAGQGRIVNVGSGNGFLAPPYFGPYAASKFAVHALSDCLRVELRRWRIPVSVVVPGSVATPIWEKSLATAERLAKEVPPVQYALYQEDLDAIRATSRRLAETATPVQRVAAAVCKAMLARRPKPCYIVGFDSRQMRMGSRFLPIRIRDALMRRGLGLT